MRRYRMTVEKWGGRGKREQVPIEDVILVDRDPNMLGLATEMLERGAGQRDGAWVLPAVFEGTEEDAKSLAAVLSTATNRNFSFVEEPDADPSPEPGSGEISAGEEGQPAAAG